MFVGLMCFNTLTASRLVLLMTLISLLRQYSQSYRGSQYPHILFPWHQLCVSTVIIQHKINKNIVITFELGFLSFIHTVYLVGLIITKIIIMITTYQWFANSILRKKSQNHKNLDKQIYSTMQLKLLVKTKFPFISLLFPPPVSHNSPEGYFCETVFPYFLPRRGKLILRLGNSVTPLGKHNSPIFIKFHSNFTRFPPISQ